MGKTMVVQIKVRVSHLDGNERDAERFARRLAGMVRGIVDPLAGEFTDLDAEVVGVKLLPNNGRSEA